MSNRSLGFYDSGVGGVSVLAELKRVLPAEDVIYFGDTIHLPYGEKTHDQLLTYGREIMDFFQTQNVKAVVFACNTISAVILSDIKEFYPHIPIIGTIKAGSRGAVQATKNQKIGVISTQNTTDSRIYTSTIQNKDCRYQVIEQACPALVPMIEQGIVQGEAIHTAVAEYLEPLLQQGIDTLVLGCTHFPFLSPLIQELSGENISLVDPAAETICELKDRMKAHGELKPEGQIGTYTFYVSGDPMTFRKTVQVICPGILQEVWHYEMKA